MSLLLNCACNISSVCSWFTLVQDRSDPSTFACEEHGDGMAEKKQVRGLPPSPALFPRISPSYLHPHLPNSPSSFTACSLLCIPVGTTHVEAGTACEREAGSLSPQREGFPAAETSWKNKSQKHREAPSLHHPGETNLLLLWRRRLKQLGNAYSWCSTSDPVKRCKYLDFNCI